MGRLFNATIDAKWNWQKKNYAKGIWYKTEQVEPYTEVHDKPWIWFKNEEFKKIQDCIMASERDTPILAKICRSERIDNSDVFIVPNFSGRGPIWLWTLLR